jgi:anaerobic selenocysteine-containing dehydrogenase
LLFVQGNPRAAARAGFGGLLPLAANRLFDAIINTPSGVVFAETTFDESWKAIGYPQHRINLHIPELMPELTRLATERPVTDPDYPLILAAGERRSDTSNTAVRSTEWHRKGRYGTLRMNPSDAGALGCADGEQVRLSTRRGSVLVPVEISDMMPPGNVSIPNGQGLDYTDINGQVVRRGVAPNELTDSFQRDFLAGTPWHKHVPARIERLTQARERSVGTH